MIIRIDATEPTATRSIAWVSLQPDGSISVGLTDRTYVSPRFRARQFVWNAYNRVVAEYLIPHSSDELHVARNPHLTFHPPIYFHLRANGDEELFAGIADVGLMLTQVNRVPWIRFVSRPITEIAARGIPRGVS